MDDTRARFESLLMKENTSNIQYAQNVYYCLCKSKKVNPSYLQHVDYNIEENRLEEILGILSNANEREVVFWALSAFVTDSYFLFMFLKKNQQESLEILEKALQLYPLYNKISARTANDKAEYLFDKYKEKIINNPSTYTYSQRNIYCFDYQFIRNDISIDNQSIVSVISLINRLDNEIGLSKKEQYKLIKDICNPKKDIDKITDEIYQKALANQFLSTDYRENTNKIVETVDGLAKFSNPRLKDLLLLALFLSKRNRKSKEENKDFSSRKKLDSLKYYTPLINKFLANKNSGKTLVINSNIFIFKGIKATLGQEDHTVFFYENEDEFELMQQEYPGYKFEKLDELSAYDINTVSNILINNTKELNTNNLVSQFIKQANTFNSAKIFALDFDSVNFKKENCLFRQIKKHIVDIEFYTIKNNSDIPIKESKPPHENPQREPVPEDSGYRCVWFADLSKTTERILLKNVSTAFLPIFSLIGNGLQDFSVDTSTVRQEEYFCPDNNPKEFTAADILKASSIRDLYRYGIREDSTSAEKTKDIRDIAFSKEIVIHTTLSLLPQKKETKKVITLKLSRLLLEDIAGKGNYDFYPNPQKISNKYYEETKRQLPYSEDLTDAFYHEKIIPHYIYGATKVAASPKTEKNENIPSSNDELKVTIQEYTSEKVLSTINKADVEHKGEVTFKTWVYVITPVLTRDKIIIGKEWIKNVADNSSLSYLKINQITQDTLNEFIEEAESNNLSIDIISPLYIVFDYAVQYGLISKNIISRVINEENNKKKIEGFIRRFFISKSLTLGKINSLYTFLKESFSNHDPIGIAILMRLSLCGIISNIVSELKWENVVTKYYEDFNYLCIEICSVKNWDNQASSLTNFKEYRLIPCGTFLSQKLYSKWQNMKEIYSEEAVRNMYILPSFYENPNINSQVQAKEIDKKCRAIVKNYFGFEDPMYISLPETGNGRYDLDLGKLYGNVFVENFRHFAKSTSFSPDEVNYLLGNKCVTTHGEHYWNSQNEISLCRLNEKMNAMFRSWEKGNTNVRQVEYSGEHRKKIKISSKDTDRIIIKTDMDSSINIMNPDKYEIVEYAVSTTEDER